MFMLNVDKYFVNHVRDEVKTVPPRQRAALDSSAARCLGGTVFFDSDDACLFVLTGAWGEIANSGHTTPS